MQLPVSDNVNRIQPSATLAITAKAAELRATGKDIISLSSGEPDFATPPSITAKAIEAINQGFTHYTPVDGIPALKEAIVNKFERENQLSYAPNQILVSNGAKHSIANLLNAYLNPGDEVLIPAPYWVSYPDMVTLFGGTPKIMTTGIAENFKITPELLDAHITSKTKLIMLNSPSNPTGVCYSKAELAAIGTCLEKHSQVAIMTDDIYEHILWSDEGFNNIVNACPELYDRTIVINGVSKAYAMTGWRIGYAAGPAHLIAAMKKVQSQMTSNPNSIAQVAAQAALDGGLACVKEMVKAFKSRHDYFVDALNKINGVECLQCDGTFYAFPHVQAVIDKMDNIADDVTLSAWLLEEAGVAVVPGTAFGAPGYIRLSYATSMQTLEAAITRLTKVLR